MRIVLASGSPRRKEILSSLGYSFETVAPSIEEHPVPGETPPEHVMRLSLTKARAVAVSCPGDLVIGADTTVVLGGTMLGKPGSKSEAIRMLQALSGKPHVVFTGLSLVILNEEIAISNFDSTRVFFNDLRHEDIVQYVESGEPLDKACSYGIQGMGSFLVNHYEGEFDTVIGFPAKLFAIMFEEVNSCLKR